MNKIIFSSVERSLVIVSCLNISSTVSSIVIVEESGTISLKPIAILCFMKSFNEARCPDLIIVFNKYGKLNDFIKPGNYRKVVLKSENPYHHPPVFGIYIFAAFTIAAIF